MKRKTSRGFKCFKCFVIFYLIFNCILGLCTALFASYLLIFRQEGRISKARDVVLCFLIIPTILTLVSSTLVWLSIKRKVTRLLKLFAVFLAVSDILLIACCLWSFTSIQEINVQVLTVMKEKFSALASDSHSENWWNDIQVKLKCCGLHGPTDYYSSKAVPFSCCGSDPDDTTKGSCSFLWQKGCTNALTTQLSQDLILLGLVGLCIALLQVPGIFITWCYAKKISQENI